MTRPTPIYDRARELLGEVEATLELPSSVMQRMIDSWPAYEDAFPAPDGFPRSKWLRAVEFRLHDYYPQSSSADRRLTARSVAPFPLRDGHDVP